mmetsp:Transcript_6319/g.12641  ORF Transcript_6319/g.12641 Transcript_6319/m.12641 type:complete len:748 (-) Transcript_6319:132-2375(-)|eukprot:scaffold1564_cov174-Amphora_coffeaeformis.AAC.9
MSDEQDDEVVTSWSSVLVSLVISAAQGAIFYGFFLYQRGKEKDKNSYDLYEPRQHKLSHRSPAPYSPSKSWWQAAWELSEEETLRCVGLDTFMYLRFLRLGARICLVGTMLSCVLIPVYATGDNRGNATLQFNKLTLARVEADSNALWGALGAWYVFVGFCLHEFVAEWRLYAKNRYNFLARGDPDIPWEYRYAVRVEQIPLELRSEEALFEYFERLFPTKVLKVIPYIQVGDLNKLVDRRMQECVAYEKAVAFSEAYPMKPRKKVTVTKGCSLTGEKRDAIEYHMSQVDKVNSEIDEERIRLTNTSRESSDDGDKKTEKAKEKVVMSNTAMVVFSSHRAKQACVQCQLTNNIDEMNVVEAPDPRGVLWNNVTTPLPQQKILSMQAAAFWIFAMLFWIVPIGFVASISNLASILNTLGVDDVNQNSAWYGLVSGLLPVIALAIFMAILYMAIVGVATHYIKLKSQSEVDAYGFYWHQLFQFTNLWLLVIGGSLFNQLDKILNDPSSLAETIAAAMPGASVFFANMINLGSLGAFGLELSMLPAYGVTMIMNLLSPVASRTQRMLDEEKKTPSIDWGLQIPRMVFVFLVAVVYMPIVPIMEVFAFIYFGGHYIVWKHLTLHVYAQEYEGGGEATWRKLFGFLLGCLYLGEFVFIAYMGVKEAPTHGALAFVVLGVTILVHVYLVRNVMGSLENLSLDVAATVDIEDGELVSSSKESLYAQPCLKDQTEEREPLPYRRELAPETSGDKA